MSFMELATNRYSCRKYADRPVEQEKLDQVLEAVRIAPTAKNLQPEHVYVLRTPEAFAKVDALTRCRFGAPVVLLFTYDTSEDWKNPQEEGVHSGVEDASIAASHAMFEAADLGLATCWVNWFPNSELERALGLPAEQRSVLLMPLGYAAEDARPAPMHEASKGIDELVSYL